MTPSYEKRVFLSLLFMILLLGGYFYVLSTREIGSIEETNPFSPSLEKSHYSSLDSSVFALKPVSWECQFPELQGQVEIFSTKNRPDVEQKKKDFAIFIKKSQQKRFAALGDQIYLAADSEGKLCFSDSPSEFWLVAKKKERGAIQLVAHLSCDGICEKKNHERSILLPVNAPLLSTPTELARYVDLKELSQGLFWGVDRLKSTYHPQKVEFERIELFSGKEIEIKEGDLLLYDGTWRRAAGSEDTKAYSIAKIVKIDTQGVEMEYWGADEEAYHTFFLPKGRDTPCPTEADNFITDIHIKTLRQATCTIEKQKIAIKSGDWIAKINGSWKVLKTEEDRVEYYQNQKSSPLLVFDKIERKSSKKWLHAHLFNPMRTQAIEIKAPVRYTKMVSHAKSKEPLKTPKPASAKR